MGMHRIGDVARGGAHLDGEYAFADQLAGADADDADAEDALGFRFDNELGQTVGPVQRERAAGSAPEKFGDLNLDVFLLGFGFGETAPGDFRIGKTTAGITTFSNALASPSIASTAIFAWL
jgi:hypothetical protein